MSNLQWLEKVVWFFGKKVYKLRLLMDLLVISKLQNLSSQVTSVFRLCTSLVLKGKQMDILNDELELAIPLPVYTRNYS